MHIVLEMPEARLMQFSGELFVTRCSSDSDNAIGFDDLLPAPAYGNCDTELTFDDLWDDDLADLRLAA